MKTIVKDHYGILATRVEKLNGMDNANYLVATGTERYILKTYPFSKDTLSLVEAEN